MGYRLITEKERPYYKHFQDDPKICIGAFNQAGYGPDDILLDDEIGHDTVGAMQECILGLCPREEVKRALLFETGVARLVYPLAGEQARSDFAQYLLLTTEGGLEEIIRRGQAIEDVVKRGTLGLEEILQEYQKRIFRLAETRLN